LHRATVFADSSLVRFRIPVLVLFLAWHVAAPFVAVAALSSVSRSAVIAADEAATSSSYTASESAGREWVQAVEKDRRTLTDKHSVAAQSSPTLWVDTGSAGMHDRPFLHPFGWIRHAVAPPDGDDGPG
jgi:hypothetical protein